MKKKKRVKRKSSKNQNMLKEALGDISKELSRLKRNKQSFIRKIETIEKSIQSARYRESELRDRITRLIAAESELSKKKSASLDRIVRLKEKINKIKKVQEELRDV